MVTETALETRVTTLETRVQGIEQSLAATLTEMREMIVAISNLGTRISRLEPEYATRVQNNLDQRLQLFPTVTELKIKNTLTMAGSNRTSRIEQDSITVEQDSTITKTPSAIQPLACTINPLKTVSVLPPQTALHLRSNTSPILAGQDLVSKHKDRISGYGIEPGSDSLLPSMTDILLNQESKKILVDPGGGDVEATTLKLGQCLILVDPGGDAAPSSMEAVERKAFSFFNAKTSFNGGVTGDAFGKTSKVLLQVCVLVNNVGVLIVYMIIIGDVLSGTSVSGVHHSGVLEKWFGEQWWNGRLVVLLTTTMAVFAPLSCLNRIYSLRYTSALAAALACVILVITAGMAAFKLVSGSIEMPRLLPDVVGVNSLWKLFTVVPALVTSYVCHYNVHTIDNELKDSSQMQPGVQTPLALCSTMYILTSFFGLILFDSTLDDVLANFDTSIGIPCSSLLNNVVHICYAIHPPPSKSDISFTGTFASSAVAASFAENCTSNGSVDRHVFLCYKNPKVWPARIDAAEFDQLSRLLSAVVVAKKADMKKVTRLTICETETSNGDVLIFPGMIRYRILTHYDVDTFVDEVLVKDVEWLPGTPEKLKGLYIFVCCHGSRDRRCGECGPALVTRFMEEIATKGLKDQVFISQHIGGHMYAGNLIVYGSNEGKVNGHWYVYVIPNDTYILLYQRIRKIYIVDFLWRRPKPPPKSHGKSSTNQVEFSRKGGLRAGRISQLEISRVQSHNAGFSAMVEVQMPSRKTERAMCQGDHFIMRDNSGEDSGDVRKHQMGHNVSRKDKIKFLVTTLSDLKDGKEAVYGAMDSWVAWEQNFPIASIKVALVAMEKDEQWHRIVQVIKWMLSKGQGTTMETYHQLIKALDMDHRPEEAHKFWVKRIGIDFHSVSWQLCKGRFG